MNDTPKDTNTDVKIIFIRPLLSALTGFLFGHSPDLDYITLRLNRNVKNFLRFFRNFLFFLDFFAFLP